MTLVEAAGVRRVFPSGGGLVEALRGVSMEVPERSLTVLRGPSGSGKTTLVNILGGLDLPTAGSVRSGGPISPPSERPAATPCAAPRWVSCSRVSPWWP